MLTLLIGNGDIDTGCKTSLPSPPCVCTFAFAFACDCVGACACGTVLPDSKLWFKITQTNWQQRNKNK